MGPAKVGAGVRGTTAALGAGSIHQSPRGGPLPGRGTQCHLLGAHLSPTNTPTLSPSEAWEPLGRGLTRPGVGWAQETWAGWRPASPVPHPSRGRGDHTPVSVRQQRPRWSLFPGRSSPFLVTGPVSTP